MISYDLAKKYIPLTETTFYILIALSEPLHGYGIMQKVNEISEEEINLGPGTLYGAIKKLLKERLIEQVKGLDNDERRKSYVLTDMGKLVVQLEYERLDKLVENSKEIVYKIRGDKHD